MNVLLGRTNSLDDLYHLEAELYRSLMNLKRYVFQEKGSVDELDLFFDVRIVVVCFLYRAITDQWWAW